MRQKPLSLIIAAACLVAGATIWQVPAYRHDIEAAEQARLEIERETEIVRAAKYNLDHLRELIEDMEAEVAKLSGILPDTLDVDARVAEIRNVWERLGCQLCGVQDQGRSQRDGLDVATLALDVCCSPSRLRSVTWWGGSCRYPAGKLTVVSEAEIGERSLRFQVELPALPKAPLTAPSRQPVQVPEITTTLWPFTALSRRFQEDVAELHTEMMTDYGALHEAELLEQRRGNAMRYVRVIEQLCGPVSERKADERAVPLSTDTATIDKILKGEINIAPPG